MTFPNALARAGRQADGRRVVVIDDDPTGTQTVSDVDVILRPDQAAFDRFFAGADRCVYVLSNTRALDQADAARHVREIWTLAEAAARRGGHGLAVVLRGDSTLRGHVFAEVDAVATRSSVTLFVPAFPEGGRTTVDGVQWIEAGPERRNVADTEFANDPEFGYQSRSLVEWVAEVGGGRPAEMVPLARVRSDGARAVRNALLAAPAGSVVIPEAETRGDLAATLEGLLAAERAGRDVVVRSASTFASLRGGLAPRAVSRPSLADPRHVLAVCGSYTAASTAQLDALVATTGVAAVEVDPTLHVAWQSGRERERLAARLRASLGRDRFAIIATSRTSSRDIESIALRADVMNMLISAISTVVGDVQGIISKGGITSAEVARAAMRAPLARVVGQLAPGVPLWSVPRGAGHAVPLAVIPGNVGGPSTLVDVARAFGVAP